MQRRPVGLGVLPPPIARNRALGDLCLGAGKETWVCSGSSLGRGLQGPGVPLPGEALRPGPQAVDSLPAPARSERAHGLDS